VRACVHQAARLQGVFRYHDVVSVVYRANIIRHFRLASLSLWAWLPLIRLSEQAASTLSQSGYYCLWPLTGSLQSQLLIQLERLVFMRNMHNILNTDRTRNDVRNRLEFFWLACSKKQKITNTWEGFEQQTAL